MPIRCFMESKASTPCSGPTSRLWGSTSDAMSAVSRPSLLATRGLLDGGSTPSTVRGDMSPADALLSWFCAHARDLPWRGAGASPWPVMVSEFMLQQTPVARVLPYFTQWMRQWPTPADLAAASPADVVRAWDTLGYPRRALWLHEAAATIVDAYGGEVPADYSALRRLSGVGDYTASAILAFAFGVRIPVIDTNVRRVWWRWELGQDDAAVQPRVEHAALERWLPADGHRAAQVSLAIMEFGALICTARTPLCTQCPIAETCQWRERGYPRPATRVRPISKRYEGSDRQARGRILAVLRRTADATELTAQTVNWQDPGQFERAVSSLANDGLITQVRENVWKLPD